MLRYLLHGLLPYGFGLHANDQRGFVALNNGITEDYVKNLESIMQKQRPHVLVFCLTESDIAEAGYREKIKDLLAHIREEGITPIINLTKADTISEELAENPFVEQLFDDREKKSDNEDLKTAMLKVGSDLGVTPDQMIYSVSYGVTKVNRTFEYDKQIFRNLEILQREAIKHARNLESLERLQCEGKKDALNSEKHQCEGKKDAASAAIKQFRKEYD